MINVRGISCSELLSEVRAYNPGADLSLIEKAYHFAEKAHRNQVRLSGEPFFAHPVSVAGILISYKLDVPTIVAGLLHDVVEDTSVVQEDIVREFGSEIAQLVEGVTKLTSMSKSAHQKSETVGKVREDNQAENIRKVFLAMARDIRVILIKLADRLHNLRTLSPLSSNKQQFIAQETLEIYAPLTHRLGLWHMMWEMEDLAFRYLDPEAFQALQQAVDERTRAREMVILEAVETLKEKLSQADVPAEIEGRSKHLYSIHLKMVRKEKELPEIYDLQAVRVLVQTVEHCYAVLGVAHGLWMPLPDRIKDYIAKPKSNHYRSLHTTVYGPGGEPLEIQIRTREMHMVAEYG
ncbi:MAG: bifunctional (p)ppGpp synthetase/guanosine-3',5'-bis(diphosphate) 3'-pyrophosphohydrolase, partial [Armatimonadetes bacterium]|nr:bifunctional (p)ppGpp synthetase/guanosine-3',5'-bis(diphosphate) 3'-pyrophosphohydrolase [Armatimonadota bacterium]